MVISNEDMDLALAMFEGRVRNPCMVGSQMEAAVYSALASLYDQAARGAGNRNDLRNAMELDAKRDQAQQISDAASAYL